jgi:hypothetical protein
MGRGIWNRFVVTVGYGSALILLPGCLRHRNDGLAPGTQIVPTADSTRAHAWNLLASNLRPRVAVRTPGMAGETFDPAWLHWTNKCSLPAPHLSGSCQQNGLQPTVQRPVEEPTVEIPQLLSTVFFNNDLASWMKTNHVAEASVLQKSDADGNDTFQPTPSKTSVMVKEIWEGFNLYKSRPWQIQVYDPDAVLAGTNGSLPAVQSWKSTLSVQRTMKDGKYDLDTSIPCKDDDYPVESNGTNVGAQVPINCFYFKRSNGPCFNLVPKGNPEFVGNPLSEKSECVIILVGLQIATREVENWTWTAFWWTNKIKGDGTEDRDNTVLPPQFHHYAMKTMVSPDQIPTETCSDKDTSEKDCLQPLFNPYLEGPSANGVHSNCLSCHARAAYKPSCVIGTPDCPANRNGLIPPPGRPRDASADSASKCGPHLPDRVKNQCPIKTNFIWSIATNQETISELTKP